MKLTSIERELNERGRCMIQTVGVSMEPLLHNRYTTVVLERVQRPLRRGDVVLFRRADGNDYVLHRIVKVRGQAYHIRGDNCVQTESAREAQILGVMTGFFNGELYTDCANSADYKRYVRTLRLRYALRWLRALPHSVVRRVKRRLR
ncbi:MAG: S24/S26 family peptidase [Eubacteriales bacterium]|nr:S24/S26 family peptidase [Eubacteriales bacterium]